MLGVSNCMVLLLYFVLFITNLCSSEAYKIDSNGIAFIEEPTSVFQSNYLVVSSEHYSDGIYRLYDIPNNHAQRIVYNGDINELMHSLTWLHVHGYKDDWIGFGE